MAKKYNSVEEMEQAKLAKANRPFYKKKRTYGLLAILLFIVIGISSCVGFFNAVDDAVEEMDTEEVYLLDGESSEESSEQESEVVVDEALSVYDANGVKVTLDNVERDNMFEETTLNFAVANNYGKNVEVTIENVSVDDVTYDSFASFEVRNGKTQKDTYILSDSDGGIPEFKDNLEIEVTVHDPETYDVIDKKVFTHKFKQ